jgi:hypothetical protein|tara:strand:- start:63 stop:983 length:921 start_codon:yes stop_codon:yes gene_type:complete
MADQKTTLEQMLEHLVNDNTAKAEELFHEYVVTKSREIYENLIEEEMDDEDVKEDSKDEEVDEASKDDDAEDKVDEASDKDEDEEDKVDESTDEEVDEEFEEVAVEADDEDPMDAMGADKGDDLESDITSDDEDGDKEPEELFQDLDSIVDELQAKFDEIKGGDDMDAGDDMDDKEEEMFAPESSADPEGDAELETMREYVEKVAGGHGAEAKGSAEAADNKKSVVDNMKNDMGGTTANIAKGGEANGKNDGGLADINAKEENAGNVNVPGAKGATKMSPEKGHGAEKKGAGENADNKQSIFRGRR